MTETLTTDTRGPVELARSYLAAWDAHDGAAVLATFAPDGTYVDPTLPGPIGGEHLVGYIAGLSAAFPDLHFDVEGICADGNQVVVRWRMRGTNTGPLPGAPQPTGGSCDLPGVDVITVGEAGIESVVGYFDQKTFIEQLGLRTIVNPADEFPMTFGTGLRMNLGNTTVPGALTMTWIEVASEAEQNEVRLRSQEILQGLAAEPGFIGFVGSFAGGRGTTLSAWKSPEAAESAMARSAAHRAAMERFRTGGLAIQGFTSLWAPHRLNRQMIACAGCHGRVEIEHGAASAVCSCGGEVTIAPYL